MKNHLLMLRAFFLNREIAHLVIGPDYVEFISKQSVQKILLSPKWYSWIYEN